MAMEVNLRAMSMSGHDLRAGTAENYRAFAVDALGRSAHYAELATAVAGDPLVLAFLDTLPKAKRQPNLLFAAACYLLGEPADLAALRMLVSGRRDQLARTMLTRRTQTNEPARCATLLPALALLPGPLALIEVGASAGLTLLVDRYSYDYDGHLVHGTDAGAPLLECHLEGQVPLPARVPEVVWRAGLDLNPLDVTDDDDVRWLECLLWPGETGRRERLAAAIDTARHSQPRVYRGDLLTDVPALVRQAPSGPTLVIYHSAVLAYLTASERAQFAELVRTLNATWLSNEGPGVLAGVPIPERDGSSFVLVQDGANPVAFTDPHGTWLRWLS
jgi:hypothetical protein